MFKGVVYNEMKGAMSDPNATFMQSIKQNLYKKSAYKFNSGGEPANITDLKYNELIEFHDKYYHPSNCTFLSYGDLDFTEHLRFIQTYALDHFEKDAKVKQQSELVLEDQVPEKPIEAKVLFMPDQMSPEETQAKFGITFICNEGAEDSYETFKLEILSELLFQGPNSPFYKKVIQSGIAPSFAPGVGYNCSFRQGTFTVGVQGIK